MKLACKANAVTSSIAPRAVVVRGSRTTAPGYVQPVVCRLATCISLVGACHILVFAS